MSSTPDIGLTEEDKQKIQAAATSGKPDDLLPEGVSVRSGLGATDTTGDTQHEYPGSNESTATREKALNAGEFERLLIGASRLDGDEGLEAWAACVVLGRLGLRGGELTHFDASWVDYYEGIVDIPGTDSCTKANDGGVCGHCKQAILQRQDHGDDRSFEEIAADYWMPKTAAAVRSIPYEWSARTQEAVALLVDLHGGWPYSYSTLQRRLTNALEAAPGLEPGDTSTHGLRATAASYHAGNGVQKEALKQMMGWTNDQTPMRYLQINGQMTSRALSEVYRR